MAGSGRMKIKPSTQLIVLVAALVVFTVVGVWVWVAGLNAEKPSLPPVPSESQSVEAVGPGVPSSGATSAPPESSAAAPTAKKVPQDKSAKKALEQIVPKWASMTVPKGGPDNAAWLKTWRAEPAAGTSLVSQSRNNFIGLFRGLLTLNANGTVKKIESAEPLWQEGDLSGWKVTVIRKLRSADKYAGVNETETLTWEFTVEQQDDGSSEVTAYGAAPDN